MAANWLKNAVFYEIYPQSFYDTNGDGIGDIEGIIQKLDYVKSIGCNALWINPWYDSPFKDAGYDVRDYKKIAPRYGSNEDAVRLFHAAHEKGIHVLIDLVPGHTSEQHEWFVQSGQAEENEFSDRFIWTDNAFCRGDGMPFIGGEMPRDGTYIINFFKSQPALNYGYHEIHESWQQPTDATGPLATREAMKDVMRFWLALGCDGFRVDMADSLVKNDDEKISTMEVWKDIFGDIMSEFPNAAFVSEWNNPMRALNCGFDMDFNLDWGGNSYNRLMRFYTLDKQGNILSDESYFKAESKADIFGFLDSYLKDYTPSRESGLWCFITGNHDTKRAAFNLSDTERKLTFAFLLTMPGAPFIYYGDEIGMAYRFLPTKEGGYHRTGSRTPMQWNTGKNLGFSEGRAEDLYLPVDPNPCGATVSQQESDPDSMLNHVRRVIALRQAHEDLGNYSDFSVYYAQHGDRLFAYKRGALLLAVNPGLEEKTLKLDKNYELIFTYGQTALSEDTLALSGQSFAVLKPVK